MFGFLERDQPGRAAVYFPGAAPPPADGFLRLRDLGYQLSDRRVDDALWALQLDHPTLGSAELWCDRESPALDDFIRFANNLSDAEKSGASGSAASVGLRVPAKRRHVLRDRKTMLRIARDVLGEDGVMVLDIASELPWSRAALDDELAHDAELDIEALYCLHAVTDDMTGDHPARWLHSHGLAELGRFDLDIVAPHPEFVEACSEPIRAIATMILEGDVAPDQGQFTFGQPGGDGRMVPADAFMRDADPGMAALRDAEHHDERRSVLCEPTGRKVLGFGRGDRPEPLHLAQRPPPDQFVIYFPTATTDLMAERARATIEVLRAAMAEFAEFEPVAVVKLGYPTDGEGKEHLWFTAHSIGETTIDATLENRPFAVDLAPGERADRPLELLTDWTLLTPGGPLTPRSMIAARRVREHADEIRAAMAASR